MGGYHSFRVVLDWSKNELGEWHDLSVIVVQNLR